MERIEKALEEEQMQPPTKDQIEWDYEEYRWRYIPDRSWREQFYQFIN